MNEALTSLIEERDAAYTAYEEHVAPIVAEKRDATEEEDTTRGELRSAVTRLDAQIDEARAELDRQAQLTEARKSAGITGNDVAVKSEPRTYEPGNGNVYFRDLIDYSIPSRPSHFEAEQRLQRHAYEQSVEVARGTDEGKQVLTQLRGSDGYRGSETRARKMETTVRERGNAGSEAGIEHRAATTSTIAGFTTPVYLVDQWIPFNQPGRPFADAVHHEDLPDYGLSVNVPHFTGASAVAVQSAEGDAVTETDPTSAYITASLATYAGQVTVSLQLLERSELKNMDQAIFDSLQRAYAPVIDAAVLTAALSGAGSTTYTDAAGFSLSPSANTQGFRHYVNHAKATIKKASGVIESPNALFMHSDTFEFADAQTDTTGRPLMVPMGDGPMNPQATGANYNVPQGPTGFRMSGLAVYEDQNIAQVSSNYPAIVLQTNEIWLFEGPLTPRVLPQTNGANLETLLQVYSYAACLVARPTAVNQISGTGMSITW